MGKRLGEVRKRKARPDALSAPGQHNRKARRAAKAQGLIDYDTAALRAMWEAFGRHQAARVKPEFSEAQYLDEHGYLDEWPAWIPIEPCVARLLEVAPEYAKLSPQAFTAEGQRLADIIAFDGGEHLTCDTGKLTKKETAQKAEHVRALGEALALFSCVPGGVKFCGMWFETVDGETHARILVDAAQAEEMNACES